ncbi:MAG: LysM peptidoglycan-binding domain-containing protein [Lactobacillus sp.]|nr:LysM peptidoglycan-binding domain-containing protein [Lactobacillus sp.]
MANRAKNHHKRKNTFKIIRAAVIVLVIAVICILGFKSDFVQGRLASSFGNNAEIQKREYNKQREIAKKKYGEYKEPKGDSEKVSSSSVASSSSESSVSRSSSSTKKNKGEYTTYTVKSGDYLSTIASKYRTTTQELMDLNNLTSGTINPGQELKVPANSSNNQDSSSADSSGQGDSDN